MASAFDQFLSNLTGQSKVELSQQALDVQQQLAKDTIEAEIQAQKLKYNPELSKQRTIQVALIATLLIIGILVFVYIKFLR